MKKYGSLARRIFLICLVFIAIPLILYGFFLWDREQQMQVRSALGQLERVGKAHKEVFEEWRKFRSQQLETYALLYKDQENLSKNPERYSLLFAFDRDLKCTVSSESAMIGKTAFFPAMVRTAFSNEQLLFLKENPYSKQKELFLLQKIEDQVWGMSVDVKQALPHFLPERIAFTLSLVPKEKRDIFTNAVFFTMEELEAQKKMRGLRTARHFAGKDLYLQLPLTNAHFFLQVEIPASVWETFEGEALFAYLLPLLLSLIVIGGIGAWLLMRRMARPFDQLLRVMDSLAEGKLESRYQKDPMGFEINDLGENFNEMIEKLLHNMEEAKKERVAKEILGKELMIGREIQSQLFPREIPEFPGLSMGRGFVPAREVAGDFYDLFPIDQEHLLLVIADASDKGVSACLYSLMVRSLLRSNIGGKNLEEAVKQTNVLFCQDTGNTGNFVTAWIALYNGEKRELTYTNAGHFPALLLSPNGEIEELSTPGVALGVVEIDQVVTKKMTLDPEAMLVLYTDGVAEAHNKRGELFGKSRLKEFMRSSHGQMPQELIDGLIAEINQFSEDVPQHDDLTILGLKALSDR
ncbi:MAG: Phosphoserine phosphatase RsbU [Chlamydiae bacterium]|nr:Phosphoserine phosphatase RsbU [Chlamydiota bacterium]